MRVCTRSWRQWTRLDGDNGAIVDGTHSPLQVPCASQTGRSICYTSWNTQWRKPTTSIGRRTTTAIRNHQMNAQQMRYWLTLWQCLESHAIDAFETQFSRNQVASPRQPCGCLVDAFEFSRNWFGLPAHRTQGLSHQTL